MSSADWRNRGNTDLRESLHNYEYGNKDKLKSAMECYKYAIDLARNDTEYSSAAKNYATASVECYKTDATPQSKVKHLAVALQYFSNAKAKGVACQSHDWFKKINETYQKCLEDATTFCNRFMGEEKAQAMQSIVKDLKDRETKLRWMFDAAEILHKESEKRCKKGDLVEARDLVSEATKALDNSKGGGYKFEQLTTALAKTNQTIGIQLEIRKGCATLKNSDQGTHTEFTLVAIDTFLNAIAMSEDTNLVQEAECYSHLGHIYDTHLKNSDRAKTHYMKCMYIAENLVQGDFISKEWYVRCTEVLKRFQKEAVDKTEEEERKAKQQYLKELKEPLDKLKRQVESNDIPALLAYISDCVEFQPEGNTFTKLDKNDLSKLAMADLRREVLKLIGRYHPDKQRGKTQKWRVLCEEITKYLNGVLGNIKGME